MDQKEREELEAKKLCHHCVGEEYLSQKIRTKGKRLRCSYCDRTAMAFRIGELKEIIRIAFETHYTRTSDQPDALQSMMLSDRESTYQWDRDGEPGRYAIMNAAQIPEDAAIDIHDLLEDEFADWHSMQVGEETEFAEESYYEEKGTDDSAWQAEWRDFELSVKTEARFFSQTAARVLGSIFNGLDALRTHDNRALIVDAGPGTDLTAFHRARVFQSEDRLLTAIGRPDLHIGPPPSALANAGRMNARGISVFYGATDALTALAEVRPPVGSQVVVARFEIIRPLRLLDLAALEAISEGGSVFDPDLANRMSRAMFLRSLTRRITRPVMPDDEAFEYLPTQAVADFLASSGSVPLDGILFPSVQVAGASSNVVLFHKASRVEEMALPEGTSLSARSGQWYEDGWETEYSVVETTPAPRVGDARSRYTTFSGLDVLDALTLADSDARAAALRVDLATVNVHQVRAVSFATTSDEVRRTRIEDRSPDS